MQSRSGGASSSRLIHAHPPHSSHLTGASARSSAHEIAFVELLGAQHEGVLAVESPAPSVERADEGAARPAALDELHAAVAAGVVVGADGGVVDAHDDDRLVENLVLDEVAGLGDLLQPARHLPDARPEQLGLQRVEVLVVVALLGDAVNTAAPPTAPEAVSSPLFESNLLTPSCRGARFRILAKIASRPGAGGTDRWRCSVKGSRSAGRSARRSSRGSPR